MLKAFPQLKTGAMNVFEFIIIIIIIIIIMILSYQQLLIRRSRNFKSKEHLKSECYENLKK